MSDPGFDPFDERPKGDQPAYVPLRPVDPRTLAGLPIPPRVWIVEEWLPLLTVTLSYGDGGVGKTLLAQQLMTCCATGRPWLGLQVKHCWVFGIFCEDDEDEVHRRQERINAHLAVDYEDLGQMRYACPVGEDNVLVRFDRDGGWELTPRFIELMKQAQEFGAELIVIDTAADTFGGNENDRQQVRAFLGPVLTKLARDSGAAVLMNAHPSKSGLKDGGSMDSGSTAWNNTARSRWALVRPVDEDGNVTDQAARVLSRRKANYSSIGDEIELTWTDGVLVSAREPTPSLAESVSRVMGAEIGFLALLDKLNRQNRYVSSSRNAGNYAPKVMAKHPDKGRHTRRDFEMAMERLFSTGRVINMAYGRRSDERFRVALPGDEPAKDEVQAEDPGIADWRAACAAEGYPQAQAQPDPEAEPLDPKPKKARRPRKPKQGGPKDPVDPG